MPMEFWTALAGIGTVGAVVVALFQPVIAKHRRMEKISNIIKGEMRENLDVTNGMLKSAVTTTRSAERSGAEHKTIDQNLISAYFPHVKTEMWRSFKYEIAAERPGKFQEFYKINRFIERISERKNIPSPGEQAELAAIIGDTEKFVAKASSYLCVDRGDDGTDKSS